MQKFYPEWNHCRVPIFNQLISNEPTKSLGIKNENVQRSIVWLVKIFNCLAYDWAVKNECEVIRHYPKWHASAKNKISRYNNQETIQNMSCYTTNVIESPYSTISVRRMRESVRMTFPCLLCRSLDQRPILLGIFLFQFLSQLIVFSVIWWKKKEYNEWVIVV